MSNEILIVTETEHLIVDNGVSEILVLDTEATEILQIIDANTAVESVLVVTGETEQLILTEYTAELILVETAGSTQLLELYEQGATGPAGPRGLIGITGAASTVAGPPGTSYTLAEVEPYIIPVVDAAIGNQVDLVGIYQLSR